MTRGDLCPEAISVRAPSDRDGLEKSWLTIIQTLPRNR